MTAGAADKEMLLLSLSRDTRLAAEPSEGEEGEEGRDANQSREKRRGKVKRRKAEKEGSFSGDCERDALAKSHVVVSLLREK